jgi:hypothetical protein
MVDPPQSEDEILAELIADAEAVAEAWMREDRERERAAKEWVA